MACTCNGVTYNYLRDALNANGVFSAGGSTVVVDLISDTLYSSVPGQNDGLRRGFDLRLNGYRLEINGYNIWGGDTATVSTSWKISGGEIYFSADYSTCYLNGNDGSLAGNSFIVERCTITPKTGDGVIRRVDTGFTCGTDFVACRFVVNPPASTITDRARFHNCTFEWGNSAMPGLNSSIAKHCLFYRTGAGTGPDPAVGNAYNFPVAAGVQYDPATDLESVTPGDPKYMIPKGTVLQPVPGATPSPLLTTFLNGVPVDAADHPYGAYRRGVYRITYTTSGEGIHAIVGDAEQEVGYLGDGTEVSAVAISDNTMFVEWSDGLKTPTRRELGVVSDLAFDARFEAVVRERRHLGSYYIVIKPRVDGPSGTHQDWTSSQAPFTGEPLSAGTSAYAISDTDGIQIPEYTVLTGRLYDIGPVGNNLPFIEKTRPDTFSLQKATVKGTGGIAKQKDLSIVLSDVGLNDKAKLLGCEIEVWNCALQPGTGVIEEEVLAFKGKATTVTSSARGQVTYACEGVLATNEGKITVTDLAGSNDKAGMLLGGPKWIKLPKVKDASGNSHLYVDKKYLVHRIALRDKTDNAKYWDITTPWRIDDNNYVDWLPYTRVTKVVGTDSTLKRVRVDDYARVGFIIDPGRPAFAGGPPSLIRRGSPYTSGDPGHVNYCYYVYDSVTTIDTVSGVKPVVLYRCTAYAAYEGILADQDCVWRELTGPEGGYDCGRPFLWDTAAFPNQISAVPTAKSLTDFLKSKDGSIEPKYGPALNNLLSSSLSPASIEVKGTTYTVVSAECGPSLSSANPTTLPFVDLYVEEDVSGISAGDDVRFTTYDSLSDAVQLCISANMSGVVQTTKARAFGVGKQWSVWPNFDEDNNRLKLKYSIGSNMSRIWFYNEAEDPNTVGVSTTFKMPDLDGKLLYPYFTADRVTVSANGTPGTGLVPGNETGLVIDFGLEPVGFEDGYQSRKHSGLRPVAHAKFYVKTDGSLGYLEPAQWSNVVHQMRGYRRRWDTGQWAEFESKGVPLYIDDYSDFVSATKNIHLCQTIFGNTGFFTGEVTIENPRLACILEVGVNDEDFWAYVEEASDDYPAIPGACKVLDADASVYDLVKTGDNTFIALAERLDAPGVPHTAYYCSVVRGIVNVTGTYSSASELFVFRTALGEYLARPEEVMNAAPLFYTKVMNRSVQMFARYAYGFIQAIEDDNKVCWFSYGPYASNNPVRVIQSLLRNHAALKEEMLDLVAFDIWAAKYENHVCSLYVDEDVLVNSQVEKVARDFGLFVFERMDGKVSITGLEPPPLSEVTKLFSTAVVTYGANGQYSVSESFLSLDYLISRMDIRYADETLRIKSDTLADQGPFEVAKGYLNGDIREVELKLETVYDDWTARQCAAKNMLYHFKPSRNLTLEFLGDALPLELGEWVMVSPEVDPASEGKVYLVTGLEHDGTTKSLANLYEFDTSALGTGIQEVPQSYLESIQEVPEASWQTSIQEVL